MRPITRIAPDVGWLPISFVNVYFLGRAGGPWVMVDAGVPRCAPQIITAAEARFGSGARPEAILLTHGHTYHAGSALELAEHWDIPIYAHRLEFPYLTGRSFYPPPDPTIGGAMAFLSRFLSTRTRDFSSRLRELKPNAFPSLTGWEWLASPGHSPGHVSFFRSSDRVLLVGDAFATMNMDSWSGLLSGRQELGRASASYNYDWEATRSSIEKLAKLRPNVVGSGHGVPMCESDLAAQVEEFAKRFRPPRHGRYVRKPARIDETGVVSLPPAPFDPVPLATAAGLIAIGIALGAGYLDEERR
jgi:glyoxylase-like metal-dependent hydrolase (beta-lactamase superfamily II)